MKKTVLAFLVAVAFLIGGAGGAVAVDAYSTNVTKAGMFVEISGLTVGDVTWTVPDEICSSTAGCAIDWVILQCAAAGDALSLKWLDEDGIEIFPNIACADAKEFQMVEYYGDSIPFFLDLSGSSLATGSKIMIKLKGPVER